MRVQPKVFKYNHQCQGNLLVQWCARRARKCPARCARRTKRARPGSRHNKPNCVGWTCVKFVKLDIYLCLSRKELYRWKNDFALPLILIWSAFCARSVSEISKPRFGKQISDFSVYNVLFIFVPGLIHEKPGTEYPMHVCTETPDTILSRPLWEFPFPIISPLG